MELKRINEDNIKYLGKYDNIASFSLGKDNLTFNLYIYHNKIGDIITLLIYPEPKNNYYIYYVDLKKNEIKNEEGKSLNIYKYFYENKIKIISFNDTEIIIGIETNEIFTNIYLYRFLKKQKAKYLYSLTSKKNSYYVIWRDPNFETPGYYREHLDKRKIDCLTKYKMNIYSIVSTEIALKFIIKRKRENDRIIFITSIEKNKNGKRFIEIVRKIYNFNIMILFYSNNTEHFKWIKDFPNCLYADTRGLCEEYISNYNIQGLKNLKTKIEKKFEKYNLKFKDFSADFLSIPIDNNIFDNKENPYIRHVIIFSKNTKKYLSMKKDEKPRKNGTTGKEEITGKVFVQNEFTNDCLWDITILNNTISLCSNNLYLKEENGKAIGFQYMVIWNFGIITYNNEKYYYFINPEKYNKNILSIEKGEVKINKGKIEENEIFILKDVQEDDIEIDNLFDNSSMISSLNNKIIDIEKLKSLSNSKSDSLIFSDLSDELIEPYNNESF